MKLHKMVEANGAYKHGRYEQIWLNSLCVMSNAKMFAMQDSRLVERTQLITCNHVILMWIKNKIKMTCNKGQYHSNTYQTLELSGFYHRTKFKRNWHISIQMQKPILNV